MIPLKVSVCFTFLSTQIDSAVMRKIFFIPQRLSFAVNVLCSIYPMYSWCYHSAQMCVCTQVWLVDVHVHRPICMHVVCCVTFDYTVLSFIFIIPLWRKWREQFKGIFIFSHDDGTQWVSDNFMIAYLVLNLTRLSHIYMHMLHATAIYPANVV